jgi:hypothetical protein
MRTIAPGRGDCRARLEVSACADSGAHLVGRDLVAPPPIRNMTNL